MTLYDVFKDIYTQENPNTVLQTLEALLKATQKVEVISGTVHQYVLSIQGEWEDVPDWGSASNKEFKVTAYFYDSADLEGKTLEEQLQYIFMQGFNIAFTKPYPATGKASGNGLVYGIGLAPDGLYASVRTSNGWTGVSITNGWTEKGEGIASLTINLFKRF